MPKFIADFHIHSRFSMATSRDLCPESLYVSARQKGIDLVGTGDFTHPGWIEELKEKLEYDHKGLLKLKDEIERECEKKTPGSCKGSVRFILTSEISNIYKKNGRVRKNHNLIFAPDFDRADEINAKLDRIGNIKSDGRPILGLDARNLLEIILETDPADFLVPAHIWTPWFSLFGSKSGFDSIEECFGDLTPHVHALETGLSSDPPMNWRISGLDRFTLISNSDAHSPGKLGREANIFDTEMSYNAVTGAMKRGGDRGFSGTLEFFPEEGKYHFDGHRKCGVRLDPEETNSCGGICRVCGKPLTLGVLHRVDDLADMPDDRVPENAKPFSSIIPLTGILSEILQVGPNSKKVLSNLEKAVTILGPEFSILTELTKEEIAGANIPLLAEAIERMRQKRVAPIPGFDGEFGVMKIFNEDERKKLLGQKKLFSFGDEKREKKARPVAGRRKKRADSAKRGVPTPENPEEGFKPNAEQEEAVTCGARRLLIVAGPGTGKTGTVTEKIIRLIRDGRADPKSVLAITFTNKAALEMGERISAHLPKSRLPAVSTFHSLCMRMLRESFSHCPRPVDEMEQKAIFSDAFETVVKKTDADFKKRSPVFDAIIRAKQHIMGPDDHLDPFAAEAGVEPKIFKGIYETWQKFLRVEGVCDFEELVFRVVKELETPGDFRDRWQRLFKHIFIDEYQDLNLGQYRMIKALASPGSFICAVGDPDQAIYGFRGSDSSYFNNFTSDFQDAEMIRLRRNYRSTRALLRASVQMMGRHGDESARTGLYSLLDGERSISIMSAASARGEAAGIARVIERAVGGYGYFSVDSGRVRDGGDSSKSFSDFAVLYRTNSFAKYLEGVFTDQGIPFMTAGRESLFDNGEMRALLGFCRILEGAGTYCDFEKTGNFFKSRPAKAAVARFKEWGREKGLDLNDAMLKAGRFPIPSMTVGAQRNLCEFLKKIDDIAESTCKSPLSEKLVRAGELSGSFGESEHGEAFKRIVSMARDCQGGSNDFFETVALMKDTDVYDHGAEKVSLMTMHAAKGLEFPMVFIAGCEDGCIPFAPPGREVEDIDEERRLFFVAMTRARESLCLSWSGKRTIYGKSVERVLSPFVENINEDLKEPLVLPRKKRKRRPAQLSLF